MNTIPDNDESEANIDRTAVSRWLWAPWYARAWWAAIPVYWLGMVASLKLPALEAFYSSALAGFLNVAFFPMTALLVLGVGYVRNLAGPIDWNSDIDHDALFKLPLIDPYTDPIDPRSGAIYARHHRH